MALERNGAERREKFLEMMKTSRIPLSGTALGKAAGVTRQVVVQDIALLRTEDQKHAFIDEYARQCANNYGQGGKMYNRIWSPGRRIVNDIRRLIKCVE